MFLCVMYQSHNYYTKCIEKCNIFRVRGTRELRARANMCVRVLHRGLVHVFVVLLVRLVAAAAAVVW